VLAYVQGESLKASANLSKDRFSKLVSSLCIIPANLVGIGVQVGDRFKLGACTPSGSEALHLLLSTLNPNSRKVAKTASHKTGLSL